MKFLLSLFSVIILITTSCKRPVESGNNSAEIERDYSDRNSNRNEREPGNRRNPVVKEEYPVSNTNNTPKSSKNLSDLFETLQREVFMIYTINGYEEISQGSGFFIAPGIGITNAHVLEDSENAIIAVDDEPYEITRILASSHSENLDYVIFETDYRTTTPLKISGRLPRIGEDIFAIGSPKGLSNSLTRGTISGFRENDRIQIDATIDHGSSGGPLFNLKGEVIGITTSGMGTGSELNFAVDIQALPYQRFVH